MPVCRSTLGALARSRAAIQFAAPKTTLVPFLYQTSTIQQYKPAARRSASSYRDRDHDLPFEGDDLPPSIERGAPQGRTTNMTNSEREAFQKLYRKATEAERSSFESMDFLDSGRVVDELDGREHDAGDAAATSLDSVFDAVLAGLPAPGKRKFKQPENLKTLAESILQPETEAAKRKSNHEKAAETARIKNIRDLDKARVQGLLAAARTDRELWSILELEVLDKIRAADIDGAIRDAAARTGKGPHRPRTTRATVTAASAPAERFPTTATDKLWTPLRTKDNDPRILFPNFPSHLVFATQLLRKRFPASPLPLTILPSIRALGRSSYALGATTALYNLLIRTIWIQYSSFNYIDELLTDMDNGGIEFDAGTVTLLEAICSEYASATEHRLGASLAKIFKMDHFKEGGAKMAGWKDIAIKRLGTVASQRSREGKVVRKYVVQGPGGTKGGEFEKGPARLSRDDVTVN